jgi:hypothetical protein
MAQTFGQQQRFAPSDEFHSSGDIRYALNGWTPQGVPNYAATTYIDTTGAYAFR